MQAGSMKLMAQGKAQVLDGRVCAAEVKKDLASRVEALVAAGHRPGLGTLLVGDDIASHKYVAGKQRDCAQVGIASLSAELPQSASTDDVLAQVEKFNSDPACDGFIVQLPLPAQVDRDTVLNAIDPDKDADGLTAQSLGRLMLSVSGELNSSVACTPRGIVKILDFYGISLAGAVVAVVGRGLTVGRPLTALLTRKNINATVIACHTGTRDLGALTAQADVVVSAAGKAHLITADMLHPGAVLVDVGISRGSVDPVSGKMHIEGDFDPSCYEVASAYTPNPGGVGPMTRAMLLENVVEAAERKYLHS